MRRLLKATLAAMVLAVSAWGSGCSCTSDSSKMFSPNCGGATCKRCTTGKSCSCPATCVCASIHARQTR